MDMTNWTEAQREDPVLSTVLHWLEAQKKTDLKTFLGQHASSMESWLVLRNHQNFMIHQRALYLHSMPKGENEDLLLLVVQRHIRSLLCMGVIKMQDIRAMTVPCPYYRNALGGQGWQVRCGNPSGPVHAVYSMRAACPWPPYTLSWPLLPWISTHLFYQHRDHFGAEPVT